MLRDARDLEPDARLAADVCIVGAGPAGITVARDLKGRGLRVLVLESGGLEPDDATETLNEGEAVGMPERRLTRCRARVLGGATSKWAGWCRPLDPADFAARPWIPGSGWPLTWADLEPWYRRAQVTCEAGALDYDPGRLQAPALPTAGPAGSAPGAATASGPGSAPWASERLATVAYQYSPPTHFGRAYRDDLAEAGDVDVFLHANLVELVLAPSGGAVAALRCATLAGGRFTVGANRIVLATGGIENARLLLASRAQEPAGIGNGSGLVGRGFMEHPHFYDGACLLARDAARLAFYLGRRETTTYDVATPGGTPAPMAAALALPAPLRREARLQGLAATLREEDFERAFAGIGASEVADLLGAGPTPLPGLFRLDLRAEQRPDPGSRVELDEPTDALGLPRVRVTWRLAPEDLDSAHRSLRLMAAELARLGIGRLWIPEDEEGRFAPPRVGAGCHHMGTTRMSARPEDGVVDADGRAHEVENLYVAGSSVFPTGGYANPTLTIVALAHRLADHLARTA